MTTKMYNWNKFKHTDANLVSVRNTIHCSVIKQIAHVYNCSSLSFIYFCKHCGKQLVAYFPIIFVVHLYLFLKIHVLIIAIV